MLSLDEAGRFGLVAELEEVAEAAGARLRAETDADGEAARAAAEQLVTAASTAMASGQSLTDITQAESHGKEVVRDGLRGDTLRTVERTGRRARETRMEHHQAIARAVRLGLSTREIAAAADLTHGTVRAISNRLAARGDDGELAESPHDDGLAEPSHDDVEPHNADAHEDEPQWSGHSENW